MKAAMKIRRGLFANNRKEWRPPIIENISFLKLHLSLRIQQSGVIGQTEHYLKETCGPWKKHI